MKKLTCAFLAIWNTLFPSSIYAASSILPIATNQEKDELILSSLLLQNESILYLWLEKGIYGDGRLPTALMGRIFDPKKQTFGPATQILAPDFIDGYAAAIDSSGDIVLTYAMNGSILVRKLKSSLQLSVSDKVIHSNSAGIAGNVRIFAFDKNLAITWTYWVQAQRYQELFLSILDKNLSQVQGPISILGQTSEVMTYQSVKVDSKNLGILYSLNAESQNSIKLRLFNTSNSTNNPSERSIATTGYFDYKSFPLSPSGFALGWIVSRQYGGATVADYKLQFFDAKGSPAGTEFVVSPDNCHFGNLPEISLLQRTGNKFLAVMGQSSCIEGSPPRIIGRHVTKTGLNSLSSVTLVVDGEISPSQFYGYPSLTIYEFSKKYIVSFGDFTPLQQRPYRNTDVMLKIVKY